MAKRIPAPSQEWGDFITCVLLHMVLPLLPLFIELWIKGSPTEQTYAITASMYSIAIGLSSRNKAMHGVCILISIMFAVVFGVVSAEATGKLSNVDLFSIGSIALVFVIHASERYNKHVVDCIPFWEFN